MLDRWTQPVWLSTKGGLTELERLRVGKGRLAESELRDLLAHHPVTAAGTKL